MDNVDEYLDNAIGKEACLLPDLLRSLQHEQKVLQGQLVCESSIGCNEWLEVASEVESILSDLESLQTEMELISKQMLDGRHWWAEEARGEEKVEQGEGTTRIMKSLTKLVNEVEELERLRAYLTWISHINHLNSQLESFVTSSSYSEAIDYYLEFCRLATRLKDSECHNLKQWVCAISAHWKKVLKFKMSSLFSSLLVTLVWPHTSSAVSSSDLNRWDTNKETFSQLFLNLMMLDDRAVLTADATAQDSVELSRPLPLPLELMVLPLRKRFRYHFMEDRKTNSLEKPEWYLTQVSNWLRDHTPILHQQVLPILHRANYTDIDPEYEFCRGLVQEVVGKLDLDMKDLASQDSLMAHLVDELLLFQRELHLTLSTTTGDGSLPFANRGGAINVLSILLREVPFDKWRNIEKMYAVERLKELTLSVNAWSPAYRDMLDADDTKVPQCTEDFIMLIKGITERYCNLPSKRHQLMFLELQVDLLLEFHQDLAQNASRRHPLDPEFTAYFNASHYIVTVLGQWGEQPLFLELLYYSKQSHCDGDGGVSIPMPLQQVQELRDYDPQYKKEEGSVFEPAVSAFLSLLQDMERRIVGNVLEHAKVQSQKYKAEKWHNMKDHSVMLCMEVSPGATDLLTSLRDHLLLIEEFTSPLLVPPLLEKLAEGLDSIILNEVVLVSSFNNGGVEQLNYDLTQYLIPMLANHCDLILQKQLFEKTREAVKLLSLLEGTAHLLADVLGPKSMANEEALISAVKALNDMGIHCLSPQQARHILKQRIYL